MSRQTKALVASACVFTALLGLWVYVHSGEVPSSLGLEAGSNGPQSPPSAVGLRAAGSALRTHTAHIVELERSLHEAGILSAEELASLGSPDADIRTESVRALGQRRDLKMVPLLSAILSGDASQPVRIEAAGALEFFDTEPTASLALVRALADADASVRENALLSLRAHRSDRVQQALLSSMRSGGVHVETREAVAAFLNRYYVHVDPFEDPFRLGAGP